MDSARTAFEVRSSKGNPAGPVGSKTCCGIFGTGWGNSASLARERVETAEIRLFLGLLAACRWRPSCHLQNRASRVSSSCTFDCADTGTTWCDSQAAAASGCHHEKQSTTSVLAEDSCDHVVLSVAAFLREDVRRGVSAPHADHAILVPRYQLALSTNARPGSDKARKWPLEKRPFPTVLRI